VVGDVLATPDCLAVLLLNHCRVVGASRLLNVGRLQVGSHIPHSAPREKNRPPTTVWKPAEREIRLPARGGHSSAPLLSRHRPDRDGLPSYSKFSWPQVYAALKRPAPQRVTTVGLSGGHCRVAQCSVAHHKPGTGCCRAFEPDPTLRVIHRRRFRIGRAGPPGFL
jgi:hypothetical protein